MLVWLVDAGSAATVVAYILVAMSYLLLRKNEPDMPRPYKLRFGGLVGVLAVAMSLFMLVLYIPGMPAGLTIEECILLGFAVLLGGVLGIFAKVKSGREFGRAEGLLQPIKLRGEQAA
jgi:amino acid transporter